MCHQDVSGTGTMELGNLNSLHDYFRRQVLSNPLVRSGIAHACIRVGRLRESFATLFASEGVARVKVFQVSDARTAPGLRSGGSRMSGSWIEII